MKLTTKTYHSIEANREYMSVWQFKNFMACPARAKAIVDGTYADPERPAFLFGSYVDANLTQPRELPKWMAENAEALAEHGFVSKKDAAKKNAPLQNADAMIARAQRSQLFMSYLTGKFQVIMTGRLYGDVEWKIMMDVFDEENKRVVDLKTSASLAKWDWMPNVTIMDILAKRTGLTSEMPKWQKGPFYEVYGYWRQRTVYADMVEFVHGFSPDFFLACLAKPSKAGAPVDIDVFEMQTKAPGRCDWERQVIEANIEQVLRWKTGDDPAPMCLQSDKCDFCCEKKEPSVVMAEDVLFRS